MIAVSLILNTTLFFLVFNIGYFRHRRQDPKCPEKPFHQLYLFPLALGILFTLMVDSFRGIFIYQMIVFFAATIILYWMFFIMPARKR